MNHKNIYHQLVTSTMVFVEVFSLTLLFLSKWTRFAEYMGLFIFPPLAGIAIGLIIYFISRQKLVRCFSNTVTVYPWSRMASHPFYISMWILRFLRLSPLCIEVSDPSIPQRNSSLFPLNIERAILLKNVSIMLSRDACVAV